jgi:hypothetical protein
MISNACRNFKIYENGSGEVNTKNEYQDRCKVHERMVRRLILEQPRDREDKLYCRVHQKSYCEKTFRIHI